VKFRIGALLALLKHPGRGKGVVQGSQRGKTILYLTGFLIVILDMLGETLQTFDSNCS
jgi:hypothetical protein